MNPKDFAIGVLTVTGAMLLSAVLILHALPPQPALGVGQLDRNSQYIMFTVQTPGSREMIGVVDVSAGLMNMYLYDYTRHALQPVQQIPVPPMQTPVAAPPQPTEVAPPAGAGATPSPPAVPGRRSGR